MRKLKILVSVASLLILSGCAGSGLLSAPQPNKQVHSQFNRMAEFQSVDGRERTTAMAFISQIRIDDNNAREARENLRLEGMNLCWQQSAGRFFVNGDERVRINKNTNEIFLVWKIICDPNRYLAKQADNRNVFSPVYLINNREAILRDGRN